MVHLDTLGWESAEILSLDESRPTIFRKIAREH